MKAEHSLSFKRALFFCNIIFFTFFLLGVFCTSREILDCNYLSALKTLASTTFFLLLLWIGKNIGKVESFLSQ